MLTRSEIEKRYRLYDNGGETLDRFTLVDTKFYRIAGGVRLYDAMAFAESLESFCQHTEAVRGRHLGKMVYNIFDLPKVMYIINEVF